MNHIENNSYVHLLRDVYPELKIQSTQSNEIGQNNDVLIVNDQLIFRFAKYRDGADRLEEETTLLERIREYVSLPIPEPIYQHFDAKEPSKTFIGYQMIEGKPLWKETLNQLKMDPLQTIASQLAKFLRELHRIPFREVIPELPADYVGPYEEYKDIYERFQEQLFPFMREDAKKAVSKNFDAFLADESHFQFEPCLIHGDYGPSNILFDSYENRVSGIIDFGGSGIGDPAHDFAGILSGYGESFLNLFACEYPGMNGILERMHFYKSTFALQEALFGIENQDKETFQNGIKDYL
ncbi:MAG TPA: aminoglycoside phosphotransferase family protein [Bacillales bacterium]|nr:aminoglycoside phosphotransferase family protein [Bacillales bacterium]